MNSPPFRLVTRFLLQGPWTHLSLACRHQPWLTLQSASGVFVRYNTTTSAALLVSGLCHVLEHHSLPNRPERSITACALVSNRAWSAATLLLLGCLSPGRKHVFFHVHGKPHKFIPNVRSSWYLCPRVRWKLAVDAQEEHKRHVRLAQAQVYNIDAERKHSPPNHCKDGTI